jgi:hypothetical protein
VPGKPAADLDLADLTAHIVGAYVSWNALSTADLPRLSVSASVGGLSVAFSLGDPPDLGINQLPEPENYEAGHLWNLLDELRYYTIKFEAAVGILDFCATKVRGVKARDDRDEYWLWSYGRHVPAYDAALTVYHFGCTLLTSIPSALHRCPTIRALADQAALKAVRREFQERMPNYALLRHAVGHHAEMQETPKKKQANAARNRMSGHGEIHLGNLEMDNTLARNHDGHARDACRFHAPNVCGASAIAARHRLTTTGNSQCPSRARRSVTTPPGVMKASGYSSHNNFEEARGESHVLLSYPRTPIRPYHRNNSLLA